MEAINKGKRRPKRPSKGKRLIEAINKGKGSERPSMGKRPMEPINKANKRLRKAIDGGEGLGRPSIREKGGPERPSMVEKA